MHLIATYFIGLVFGIGISISGMASPAKVLNFFDVAGSWDPSLIFVMGGALAVTFVGYRAILARSAPLFSAGFHLPANRSIDLRLIGGSALFGVGWGISGFCPGGALPALGTGRWEVALFVVCLLAGIGLARFLQSRGAARAAAKP